MNKALTLSLLCFFIIQNTVAQRIKKDTLDIIKKTYTQNWELDSLHRKGTFRLVSYKPIYVTTGRVTSKANERPTSENPDYAVPEGEDFNPIEAKFQLSFKTKVVQ